MLDTTPSCDLQDLRGASDGDLDARAVRNDTRGSRVARAVVRKPLAVPNSLKNADGSRIAERKMERELNESPERMDWNTTAQKASSSINLDFCWRGPRC